MCVLLRMFNFGFQSKGFNATTIIDKSICPDTCVRKIFSGWRMLLSSVMLCSAEMCFGKCLLYIWAQAKKCFQWLSWKAGGNKRHRQFYHFCLLFLKKKTLGASLTSASQTLKKNIIHTFSRGSFLLMGGLFPAKRWHLLFQADQGWLLIDFYRTMSSFTT